MPLINLILGRTSSTWSHRPLRTLVQGGLPGRNLLQIAYDQCRLYRDALRDDSGLLEAYNSWFI